MKTAGAKIDMENDTANIFGKDQALYLSFSGHYCVSIGRSEAVTAIAEDKERTDIDEGRTELHSELCIPPKLRRQESHIQGTLVFKDIHEDPSAKTGSKNCKRVNMQTGVNENIKEAFHTDVRADEQTSKSGNNAFQLKRTKKRHLAKSDEQHANFEERQRRKQQESGEGKIELRIPERQEIALKTVFCDDRDEI